MEEEKPVLQEIEDKKEKWISRISLWVSVLLTTAIVIWYYQSNPPESPEVVRMRVFFKEKNRDVMKFISMDRNEQIAFAFKNKHPFYLSYIRKSTVEQEKIRSLVHVSTDFTPNQYWFNLGFMWVIVFTTFWFLGLMTEACIVLMRRETEARIKNYQKEKEREQRLASDERESPLENLITRNNPADGKGVASREKELDGPLDGPFDEKNDNSAKRKGLPIMIWNLSLHIGAGYFGSEIFATTPKGILTCVLITAFVQGIDMFRFISEATADKMEPQPLGALIGKATQMYIMKIIFYGSVTLFVARLVRGS